MGSRQGEYRDETFRDGVLSTFQELCKKDECKAVENRWSLVYIGCGLYLNPRVSGEPWISYNAIKHCNILVLTSLNFSMSFNECMMLRGWRRGMG